MALAKLRRGKHPAQAIKQAGNAENEDPCAFDGNAGVARRHFIRADGIKPAPQARAFLNDIGNRHCNGGNPYGHRDFQYAAKGEKAKGRV